MTKASAESQFDCVGFMREARARIDAATSGMTDQERLNWYRSREYADPWFAKMSRRMRGRNSGPLPGKSKREVCE